MSQQFEALQQELIELRTRLEVQEEKGRSMRTLQARRVVVGGVFGQEARDEQLRSLIDRVERENWDARLRSTQQRLQARESHEKLMKSDGH